MTYSPVQPAVNFLARDCLEKLDHEERKSDHECEEVESNHEGEDPAEEIMMQDPVIDLDDELRDLEENVFFQEETSKTQPDRYTDRQKQKYREKRSVKRLLVQNAKGTNLKAIALKKRSDSGAHSVNSSSNFQKGFIPSKPAWKAMPDVEKDEREFSLDELVKKFGTTVIDWDGR